MTRRIIFLSSYLLFNTANVDAQNLIRLSSRTRENQRAYMYIAPGDRILVKLKDNSKKIVGHITNITDSTFKVGNMTISIDSVEAIGKHKRAGTVFMIAGIAVPLALIFTGQVNKFGSVIAATSIGLAVSLSSLRYVGAVRTRDFNLEVIDFRERSKR